MTDQGQLPTMLPPLHWSNISNGSFALPEATDVNLNMVCNPPNIHKVYSRGWLTEDNPFQNSLTLFMFQVPLFLLLSKTLYFLFRPIKQTRIVCDITAGILFGPTFVPPDTHISDYLFPLKYQHTVRTLATYGIMYHLFLMGVKMDLAMVLQSGRKAFWIGISSATLPLVLSTIVFYLVRDLIIATIARDKYFIFLIASISLSAFPVLGDILAEEGLLNTELGRLGMSAAMIHWVFGWFFMALFTIFTVNRHGWRATVYATASMLAMIGCIVFVIGPFMRRVARNTPKGKQVKEGYIVCILVCVMLVGLLSDAIGGSPVQGPVILGLMVPPGPPWGSALVQRLELMLDEVLMPFFFFAVGNTIKVPPIEAWRDWFPIVAVVVVAYAAKMVGTILPAMRFKIPLHKAIFLGLIMNFRGVVEIITFFHLRAGKVLDNEGFALLLLLATLSTGIAAPLVSTLYDPNKTSYNSTVHRSIQHTKNNSEFLILACLQNEEPVPAMIGLIEATSEEGPTTVYPLHLVELRGRATSALIPHRDNKGYINIDKMECVLHAFINFEHDKRGRVTVMPFTTVAPYRTMHHDICSLAAQKMVVLLLVPYPRKDPAAEETPADRAIRSIMRDILAQAPCTVGILVHQTLSVLPFVGNSQPYLVCVLFWGGSDDRESLMYASRLARHPCVHLTVKRFLQPSDNRDEQDRLLDDGLVQDFKIIHSENKRVSFRDVTVKSLEETYSAIRSLDTHHYDLLITGLRQGLNSYLTEELEAWTTECPPLGIVGDMLASQDFQSSATILIMQHH